MSLSIVSGLGIYALGLIPFFFWSLLLKLFIKTKTLDPTLKFSMMRVLITSYKK